MGFCAGVRGVSHSPSAGTRHLPGSPCSISSVSHSLCCRPWGSGDAMWERKTPLLPSAPGWEPAPQAEVMFWVLMSWHLFFHPASIGLSPR